mmetsp:Transcript_22922/g.43818  ORF Transcript_22922/g.43818 Transcript_22922/m.43818 type:complete len:449 (+) Transcript_22922:61-1407(+)
MKQTFIPLATGNDIIPGLPLVGEITAPGLSKTMNSPHHFTGFFRKDRAKVIDRSDEHILESLLHDVTPWAEPLDPTWHAEQAEIERSVPGAAAVKNLIGHIIVCGGKESFSEYIRVLRSCEVNSTPVVILHPMPLPEGDWRVLCDLGKVHYVEGNAKDLVSQRAARAFCARTLVCLQQDYQPKKATHSERENGITNHAIGASQREAILSDADALLTCFGADSSFIGKMQSSCHIVVELRNTSSMKFLQPTLMSNLSHALKRKPKATYDEEGSGVWEKIAMLVQRGDTSGAFEPKSGVRLSWLSRRERERVLERHGLAPWQGNAYYCSGRVLVPTLMETYGACQWMFNHGLFSQVMNELKGHGPTKGGTMLRQIPVPSCFVGFRYRQLFRYLAVHRSLIPIALYRDKPTEESTSGGRLKYVHTNPDAMTQLEATDRVFIIRENGGAWLV